MFCAGNTAASLSGKRSTVSASRVGMVWFSSGWSVAPLTQDSPLIGNLLSVLAIPYHFYLLPRSSARVISLETELGKSVTKCMSRGSLYDAVLFNRFKSKVTANFIEYNSFKLRHGWYVLEGLQAEISYIEKMIRLVGAHGPLQTFETK
jgi:hypothetical protein